VYDRAYRRAALIRRKKQVRRYLTYWYWFRLDARTIGKMASSRGMRTCSDCKNPRREFGIPTPQETRVAEAYEAQIRELATAFETQAQELTPEQEVLYDDGYFGSLEKEERA
jgi:hypothetical protein